MFEKERFSSLKEHLKDRSVTIIANPKAGNLLSRKTFRHAAEQITSFLEDKAIKVDTYRTKGRGHATELAWEAKEKGAGLVLVRGGDGTANEVLRGLLSDESRENETVFGVLGGGTQNVWAKAVHTPRRLVDAAHVLLHGRVKETDIGKVMIQGEAMPFLINAGFGLDAQALQSMDLAGQRGRFALALHTLQQQKLHEPNNIQIINHDTGETIAFEDMLQIAVINAGKYGIFNLTDSKADDQLIELAAFEKKNFIPARLMRMATQAFLRDIIPGVPKVPHVLFEKGRRFQIKDTQGKPFLYQTDGEVQKKTDSVEVSLYEKGAKVLIPDKEQHGVFTKS